MSTLSTSQRLALVGLRIAIGWHFLYEGVYKMLLPGWTRDGLPVKAWTASGYLTQAGGPLGGWFQWLAQPSAIGWIDTLVPLALAAIGLSLMLGLFTQFGCAGAAALLALFYASALPLSGMPQPGSEGTYLIVNKNLIELVAVLTLATFRTGQIAGLDAWLARRHVGGRAGAPAAA
jgi:thiosulfate dehydrogenase (quinone) large subunit